MMKSMYNVDSISLLRSYLKSEKNLQQGEECSPVLIREGCPSRWSANYLESETIRSVEHHFSGSGGEINGTRTECTKVILLVVLLIQPCVSPVTMVAIETYWCTG